MRKVQVGSVIRVYRDEEEISVATAKASKKRADWQKKNNPPKDEVKK